MLKFWDLLPDPENLEVTAAVTLLKVEAIGLTFEADVEAPGLAEADGGFGLGGGLALPNEFLLDESDDEDRLSLLALNSFFDRSRTDEVITLLGEERLTSGSSKCSRLPREFSSMDDEVELSFLSICRLVWVEDDDPPPDFFG